MTRTLIALLLLAGCATTPRPKATPLPHEVTITILHTNDTHAQIEPVNAQGGPCGAGEACWGGVARRVTAVKAARAERPASLLVDAGDVFMGTLYFHRWQGQADAFFMNQMGYQAMTLGNHEFDRGPAVLGEFVRALRFPVVAANCDVTGEPALAGRILPSTVVEVGGTRVGVFGLTREDAGQLSAPGPNVRLTGMHEAARKAVASLEAQGVNVIVAVTHIGYEEDRRLAESVPGIDVIVGGHSHALLGTMAGAIAGYPQVVERPEARTLIVTAGTKGKHLGKLEVVLDEVGRVVRWSGQPIELGPTVVEDEAAKAKVAEYGKPIAELTATAVGEAASELDGDRIRMRTVETNLGDLVCDAILERTRAERTSLCLNNGGAIRSGVKAGKVTVGDVLAMLPFGATAAVVELTGQQVHAALEHGLSEWSTDDPSGRFMQVGGALRYRFDPLRPSGARVVSVEVGGRPLDRQATYRVATTTYLTRGGDGFAMMAEGRGAVDTGLLLADILVDHLKQHRPVDARLDGRIQRVQPGDPR